jgi:uncharacterized protein YjbI with pentapeptide repeats
VANQEHLDILKQGRAMWNEWRIRHLEMKPELSRADLRDAEFSGANFKGATFCDTDLSHAHTLTQEQLDHASLSRRNLTQGQNIPRTTLRLIAVDVALGQLW